MDMITHPKPPERPYNHAEAYCLMEYASKDGQCRETIWNSRDGITPFIIRCRDGSHELSHINWQNDRREPQYVPTIGERMFVDMDRHTAESLAKRNTRRDLAQIRSYGMSPKAVRAARVQEYYGNGHAPHIVTVDGVAPPSQSATPAATAGGEGMITAEQGLDAIGNFLAEYVNRDGAQNAAVGAQIVFLAGVVMATEYPETAAKLLAVIGTAWTAEMRGTIDVFVSDMGL